MRVTKSQIAQIVREEIQNLIKEKDIKPISDYVIEEAEYQGKKVELGKVKRGGTKKFYVYVKDPKTKNVKKVSFGDTTGLSIKTKDPKRRKAFRDRHNCDNPGPKTKARYWSCRMWSGPNAIKNMLGK
tara:strand:- start:234 stop:617 length:384 start_codon:yes stop_codon:yes gene_type:complete